VSAGVPWRVGSLQVVARERDGAAGELELDSALSRREPDDDAAVSVDDPERAVVATQHDAIANRERGARDSHLLRAEHAADTHESVRAPVEIGDVDTALGDHQRPVWVALSPPVGDQAVGTRVRRRVPSAAGRLAACSRHGRAG